jgi:hypothetical protein
MAFFVGEILTNPQLQQINNLKKTSHPPQCPLRETIEGAVLAT